MGITIRDDQVLKGMEAATARRRDARHADIRRLLTERRVPVWGFKWAQRYDIKYILQYARKRKWNASRLTTAVETLDRHFRINRNAAINAKRRNKNAGTKKR